MFQTITNTVKPELMITYIKQNPNLTCQAKNISKL